MELMDVMRSRRSVRAFKSDPVDRDVIEGLIEAAVLAPTAMNMQPWTFGVLQDADKLHEYSERIKVLLLSQVEETPWLARFQEYFQDPRYNVFYGAPALVVIYARNSAPMSQIDCALAAENFMLAACSRGLGTCWIGFSTGFLNLPGVKAELGVPAEYQAVAPLIVGVPEGEIASRDKRPPEVVYWR